MTILIIVKAGVQKGVYTGLMIDSIPISISISGLRIVF